VLVGLGVWADLGALLLAGFVLVAAPVFRDYWAVPDPQMRSSEQAHFFKNVSLAGGALLAFVVVQELGAGLEYALGDPLF